MKNSVWFMGFFLFVFPLLAIATPKILLECRGFEHDTLELVQVVTDPDSGLMLIEFHSNEQTKSAQIVPAQLESGPLELSPLGGYTRALIRNKDRVWKLKYGCGEVQDISCKE